MIEGGLIKPRSSEETDQCPREFSVLKSNGEDARVVTDFKNMNRNGKRPTHPTEPGTQLLRYIKANSKYFATLDMCSGHHKIAVDEESSK